MANYDRRERVGEEIKKQLSQILPGLKELERPALFSVMSAEISGDFRLCKVGISTLGTKAETETFCRALQAMQGKIRHELGTRVKIHHTPELVFEPDDSIAHSVHISDVISKLNIPPAEPDMETDEEDI